jgi:hypothetical protein
MKKILASLALSALVLAPQAQAQEDEDVFGYIALLGTPAGALAPIATPAMMGAQQMGLGYSFRYGKVTGDDAPNNFAVGASYGHSSGAYGITLGYLKPSEDGVDGQMMLGGNWSRPLTNIAMSATSSLNIGIDAGLGWTSGEAIGFDASALSVALNVPVSTVMGSGAWRFVPYVQPGLGHGRFSVDGADETLSGTKFMLGLGLGIQDQARGIGFNVGMQKVFQDEGENVIGLGFSWNPKR